MATPGLVVKITKGQHFGNILAYDLKDHHHAQIIGGNILGRTVSQLLPDLEMGSLFRPNIENPVFHCSLSFGKDKIVYDSLMRDVAADYLEGMGWDLGLSPYILIRHFDRDHAHCHLITSRIQLDGKLISETFDYYRNRLLCRELEIQYGLAVGSNVDNPLRPPTKNEREMIERTDRLSVKVTLQSRLVEIAARCTTMSEFVERAEGNGVGVLPFFDQSLDRFTGISYRLGEVKLRGRVLGKSLSFLGLQEWFGLGYEQQRDDPILHGARYRETQRAQWSSQSQREGEGVECTHSQLGSRAVENFQSKFTSITHRLRNTSRAHRAVECRSTTTPSSIPSSDPSRVSLVNADQQLSERSRRSSDRNRNASIVADGSQLRASENSKLPLTDSDSTPLTTVHYSSGQDSSFRSTSDSKTTVALDGNRDERINFAHHDPTSVVSGSSVSSSGSDDGTDQQYRDSSSTHRETSSPLRDSHLSSCVDQFKGQQQWLDAHCRLWLQIIAHELLFRKRWGLPFNEDLWEVKRGVYGLCYLQSDGVFTLSANDGRGEILKVCLTDSPPRLLQYALTLEDVTYLSSLSLPNSEVLDFLSPLDEIYLFKQSRHVYRQYQQERGDLTGTALDCYVVQRALQDQWTVTDIHWILSVSRASQPIWLSRRGLGDFLKYVQSCVDQAQRQPLSASVSSTPFSSSDQKVENDSGFSL